MPFSDHEAERFAVDVAFDVAIKLWPGFVWVVVSFVATGCPDTGVFDYTGRVSAVSEQRLYRRVLQHKRPKDFNV